MSFVVTYVGMSMMRSGKNRALRTTYSEEFADENAALARAKEILSDERFFGVHLGGKAVFPNSQLSPRYRGPPFFRKRNRR